MFRLRHESGLSGVRGKVFEMVEFFAAKRYQN
jgi:hypothetical protein